MRATAVATVMVVGLCLGGCGGEGSSSSSSGTATAGTSTRALPRLNVNSASVTSDGALQPAQLSGRFGMAGGQDRSPALAWNAGPPGTTSYAVTVYDPDAKGGFWHWVVTDLPSDVTALPAGAGAKDGAGLPKGATQAVNDAGSAGYVGAAPPAGDPAHHYHLVVTALDLATLDTTSAAASGVVAAIDQHALARGEIVATAVRAH